MLGRYEMNSNAAVYFVDRHIDQAQGDQACLLRLAREFEDAILHLRLNEMDIGLWVIRTQGDPEMLLQH